MSQHRLLLELLASTIPEWMSSALCKGEDTNLFFPEGYGKQPKAQAAAAIAICDRCPVKQRCFDYSIATRQRFGIYGGVDERTREKLLVDVGRLRAKHGTYSKSSICTDGPGGGMCNDCREAKNEYRADLRRRKQEAKAS